MDMYFIDRGAGSNIMLGDVVTHPFQESCIDSPLLGGRRT